MALADAAPPPRGGRRDCHTCTFLGGLSTEDAKILNDWIDDKGTFSAPGIADRLEADEDYTDTPSATSIERHRAKRHGAH